MYKLLLCWRYLRTRWIALASVVSVTLGVATMIVVNSVMEGFRNEMQQRIHGILSDLVFESNSLAGFYDADWHMDPLCQQHLRAHKPQNQSQAEIKKVQPVKQAGQQEVERPQAENGKDV